MSVVPVVAAYGGVGQAGVTGVIDAVGVGIELGGAATAAGVGDVPVQRHQDIIQGCGAVQDRLRCSLGRQRILEVEAGDLDSELHVTWWRREQKQNIYICCHVNIFIKCTQL